MLGLPRSRIIKRSGEFQRLYTLGRSYGGRYFILKVFAAPGEATQVAFAAGKRLGNAVVRNRVKRLLRESYRLEQEKILPGFKLMLIGRAPIVDAKQPAVGKELRYFIRKAGIMVSE